MTMELNSIWMSLSMLLFLWFNRKKREQDLLGTKDTGVICSFRIW